MGVHVSLVHAALESWGEYYHISCMPFHKDALENHRYLSQQQDKANKNI